MRDLLVADSRLGDIGDETRFGVACLMVVALEGGLGETLVGSTTEVIQAGETSREGEVRELDKDKEGDADESLVVLMEKVGEVVSGSCWLLDMDTGEGASNWVVSCT